MGENRPKKIKSAAEATSSAASLVAQHGCLDRDWLQEYPRQLVDALARQGRHSRTKLYVTGGAIRDWIVGRASQDLDVTVPEGAFECARFLARELGGTFVPLDQEEDVARLVWKGWTIDFSAFREGAITIEEDLGKRDFTINALAVSIDVERGGLTPPYQIIDPTGGVHDLQQGIVRATCDSIFASDPLRLLRAYRFMATLGFSLAEDTEKMIRQQSGELSRVSAERVSYELGKIIESPRPATVFRRIADSSLLWIIFPELKKGEGMDQPASHHLDVFSHNLETLSCMVRVQGAPDEYFPSHGSQMAEYLAGGSRKNWLRWAALFHDLGKPDAYKILKERITFYNHDRAGSREFEKIAARLKLSNEDSKKITRFIELHMWPFHLSNARLKTGITAKACLRLVKAVGEELPGLFVLAMADSLAGLGPEKPRLVEEALADLYGQVDKVYQEHIKPVFKGPRLVNGHDLKKIFGLTPGPIFRKILDELETNQVAGEIQSRDDAIDWVHSFLKSREVTD